MVTKEELRLENSRLAAEVNALSSKLAKVTAALAKVTAENAEYRKKDMDAYNKWLAANGEFLNRYIEEVMLPKIDLEREYNIDDS